MREFTRRSLLANALGGVVAGGVVRSGSAWAALSGPPTARLSEQPLGDLPAVGRTVALSANADLLGVSWEGPAAARVQLRFRATSGGWTRWLTAGPSGHGPDGSGARGRAGGRLAGDPIWTGGTRDVQLRASSPLVGARLVLVDVSAGVGAHLIALRAGTLAGMAAPSRAQPVLAAGPGQPPIIAREVWAAGVSHPRVAPEYGEVAMAFVHHTENPNGYLSAEVPAMLRAIFVFHRDGHGWNDIGYNFVIDTFGRIFEARAGGIDEPVVGAHAGGYNAQSTGVAVLGDFQSTGISTAARRALTHLLAWKLSLHGVPSEGQVTVRVNPAGAVYSRFPAGARVRLPRVAGHRDGDSTDCPGNGLYSELPTLRPVIHRLAGEPVQATLSIAPDGEGALIGALKRLDGTPLASQPVTLQARHVTRKGEVVRERSVIQGVTDAEGTLSLVAPPSRAAWLRLLFAGAPGLSAAVSPALRVPARGAPVTLPPGPSPEPAPGAPAPRTPAPGGPAPTAPAPTPEAPVSPSL